MERVKKVVTHRVVRFGIVGVGNTLLNFAVLNSAFFVLHVQKIVASVLATICAASVSFFLNRNFVFRHRDRSSRQPIMFALVTVTGVLLVQNLVFALLVAVTKTHTKGVSDLVQSVVGLHLSQDFVAVNGSNLLASLVAMVWNYNGYKYFVFKSVEPDEAFIAA